MPARAARSAPAFVCTPTSSRTMSSAVYGVWYMSKSAVRCTTVHASNSLLIMVVRTRRSWVGRLFFLGRRGGRLLSVTLLGPLCGDPQLSTSVVTATAASTGVGPLFLLAALIVRDQCRRLGQRCHEVVARRERAFFLRPKIFGQSLGLAACLSAATTILALSLSPSLPLSRPRSHEPEK